MQVIRKGDTTPDPSRICGCSRGFCREPRLHGLATGEEADDLRLDISEELSKIKVQLLEASADRRVGRYADVDWYRKVTIAKGVKGRQLMWLQTVGKELRGRERHAKRDTVEEERLRTFKAVVREKLGEDAYRALWASVDEIMAEAACSVAT